MKKSNPLYLAKKLNEVKRMKVEDVVSFDRFSLKVVNFEKVRTGRHVCFRQFDRNCLSQSFLSPFSLIYGRKVP